LHYFTSNFWLGYWLTGVPVITHIRSPLWMHIFERSVMSHQYRIIFVSNSVKNEFIQKRRSDTFVRFHPERLQVIYDGHNLAKFRDVKAGRSIREEFRIGPEEKVIILLGAIDPVKGQDLLIQAAARIVKKYPNSRYLIVGELYANTKKKVEYFDNLKAMVKQFQLEDNVIFTDYREDVPEILNSVDILVQPSVQEALGGCLIEAMASGKPVVGTPVHGIPEIIGKDESGVIMKERSADALAESLLYLLDHPDIAKERGLAGQKRAQRLFELKTNNQKIYDVYEEAINSTDHNGRGRTRS